MFRIVFSVLLATAIFGAGAVSAQNVLPASDLTADQARSNALTSQQRNEANEFFRKAFDLLQSGDLAGAQAGFERGLAIDPANAEANYYLAETLTSRSATARARAFYDKVIALDRNSAIAAKADAAIKNLSASGPSITPGIGATNDGCTQAAAHWASAESLGSRQAYEDHLTRFTSCAFATLAKARIASLDQKAAAPAKTNTSAKKCRAGFAPDSDGDCVREKSAKTKSARRTRSTISASRGGESRSSGSLECANTANLAACANRLISNTLSGAGLNRY